MGSIHAWAGLFGSTAASAPGGGPPSGVNATTGTNRLQAAARSSMMSSRPMGAVASTMMRLGISAPQMSGVIASSAFVMKRQSGSALSSSVVRSDGIPTVRMIDAGSPGDPPCPTHLGGEVGIGGGRRGQVAQERFLAHPGLERRLPGGQIGRPQHPGHGPEGDLGVGECADQGEVGAQWLQAAGRQHVGHLLVDLGAVGGFLTADGEGLGPEPEGGLPPPVEEQDVAFDVEIGPERPPGPALHERLDDLDVLHTHRVPGPPRPDQGVQP